MTESERINALMAAEQMKAKQFAEEIGIQNGTLSNILSGRNKPSLDVMCKILNRFREVSSDWLILGVGSMFSQKNDSRTVKNEQNLFDLPDDYSDNEDVFVPNNLSNAVSENPVPKNISAGTDTRNKTFDSDTRNKTFDSDTRNKAFDSVSKNKSSDSKIKPRKIQRIIVYFDDGTFQEFFS